MNILRILILKTRTGNMMLHPLFVILDSLKTQEYASQYQGQDQKRDNRLLLSKLRGAHCQDHGEAAANQDARVDGADGYVHEMAGGGERLRVHVAIHGIAAKHSAEEHDFGEQKYPHPQRGGFHLLGSIVKVMLQLSRVRWSGGQGCVHVGQVSAPLPSSCRAVRSQSAARRNSAWAAASAIAPIRVPSRSRDSAAKWDLCAMPRRDRSSAVNIRFRVST